MSAPHEGVHVRHDTAPNGAGWTLSLRRTTCDRPEPIEHRHATPRRPVLIVPGYGMNSFIFGFHPRGRSLEAHLAYRGFEVWSVDLRDQGRARRTHAREGALYGLADLALVDVRAAIDHVLAHTETGATKVDIVGCSLGAAIMFIEATVGGDDRMASLVSLGGPLRWEKVHPLVSVAFRSPRLAGMLSMRGTRSIIRKVAPPLVPVLKRVPQILSIYLNSTVTDISRLGEMVETVEDPIPRINQEIAEWILQRDLHVRGVNVSEAVARLRNPLLCIVAGADGIVPPETARSPYHLSRAQSRRVLEVGGRDLPIAHADLFLCHDAERILFEPLAQWLAEQDDAWTAEPLSAR